MAHCPTEHIDAVAFGAGLFEVLWWQQVCEIIDQLDMIETPKYNIETVRKANSKVKEGDE